MGITKGKSFHSQIIDFIKLRSMLNPPSKKSSLFEHNVIWHPSVGRKFILLEPGEMVLRHHEMATIGSLIDSDKSPWVSAESYDGSLVSPPDTPTKETILFKKINKRD